MLPQVFVCQPVKTCLCCRSASSFSSHWWSNIDYSFITEIPRCITAMAFGWHLERACHELLLILLQGRRLIWCIDCQTAHHIGTAHGTIAHLEETGTGGRVRVHLHSRDTSEVASRSAISTQTTQRTVCIALALISEAKVRVPAVVHEDRSVTVRLAGEVFPTHTIVALLLLLWHCLAGTVLAR